MGSRTRPRHSSGRKAATSRSKRAARSPRSPTKQPDDIALEKHPRNVAPNLYEIGERLDRIIPVVHTVCDAMSTHENADHAGLTLIEYALEPLIKVRDDLRKISRQERSQ